MRKRSELFFSLILIIIDFLMLVTAFVAAYIYRVRIVNLPVAHPIGGFEFLRLSLLVLPVWILIFALAGLYNLSSVRSRLQELGKIFVAVSGGVMFLILLDFLNKTPLFPSRSIPIYAYGLGLVLVVLGRTVVRGVQRYLFRYNIGVHQTLILGSGPIAKRLADSFADVRSGYRLLGAIDDATGAAKRMKGMPVYESLDQAMASLGDAALDEIIQADSALAPEEVLAIVTFATNNQLIFRFVPNQFGLYASNSVISTMAGMPVVEIRLTPLEGWGRIAKRLFDVVGAVVGLVIFSPVFLVAAIAIKLTDGGPVFYRHQRLSRAGKPVGMWKFRSMYTRYSTGGRYGHQTAVEVFEHMGRMDLAREFEDTQKVHDDPRVTPIGRFLRKTSLDEVPQFMNVFAGSMSLVGPRPIIPDELVRYGDSRTTFLALKPGITGLWQISGRSDIGYDERVKLDIYYVENWSLWLDIKILTKTLATVAGSRGAY
jgi:exopolysaccharide biosynthesis polyprenyl glycosylphosphotransferase